jgi:peptidoglycan/LPS O-acetylase OafA/YrhL
MAAARSRASTAGGPRRDIQGLRALAVLIVVSDHVLGWPAGGFVGVDVFFVISGFLITGLLLKEAARTGRISFADFYRRRVRRILPAAMATVIVTVGGSYLVFNSGRFASVVGDAIWSALFAANWRFASTGTDYFAGAGPVSPLQHFWSLAVEEQFYVVWPVLIVAAVAWARRGSDVPDPARVRRIATVLIVLVSLASFAWACAETASAPTLAYFSTFSRAWELGVGALLALVATHVGRLPSAIRPVLSWLGLAGIIASCAVITEGSSFPAPAAALPVVSAALVLAAGIGASSRLAWPLTNRVSTVIGDMSYSLYLWHFPALIVAGPFIAHLLGSPDSPLVPVAVLATAFAAAAASYYGLEQPVRRSAWLDPRARRGTNRRSVPVRHLAVVGMAAVTVVVVTAAFIVDGSPSSTTAGHTRTADVPGDATGKPGDGAEGAALAQDDLSARIEAALAATEWPADLSPTLDTVDAEPLPGNTGRCGGAVLLDAAECTFGDPDAPKTAVLVGDSIAHMYVPALVTMFGTGEWKLRVVSMYACPFLGIEVGDAEQRVEVCTERKRQEVEVVNETSPDLLIVANTYWRSTDSATGVTATIADWDAGFREIMDTVAGAAAQTLVLPPPAPDVDIQECLTAFAAPAECVSSIGNTDWADMANAQSAAVESIGGIWVDNRAWFCGESDQCPAFVGSTLMKKDKAHITAEYAALIAPAMREMLTTAGVPMAAEAATPEDADG